MHKSMTAYVYTLLGHDKLWLGDEAGMTFKIFSNWYNMDTDQSAGKPAVNHETGLVSVRWQNAGLWEGVQAWAFPGLSEAGPCPLTHPLLTRTLHSWVPATARSPAGTLPEDQGAPTLASFFKQEFMCLKKLSQLYCPPELKADLLETHCNGNERSIPWEGT